MTLMIVEDDSRMGQVMAELFEPLFERIEVCADGMQAVSRFDDLSPEVVVMDIRLPGIDGLEVTERIIHNHPSAHIFVVTAYDEPRYRVRATRSGACGFFLKDDLSILYDSVERFRRAS